ncbi:MAG TPA: copper chaperone PCu(A)C [Rhodoblastus sp.]|nr:copper chaperone PCu(A)C [Rhodoblastus sp.]
MKTVLKTALAAAILSGASVLAHAGDIALDHPWSRATPAGAPVGAGYVTLKNTGAAADKLLSATAPDVAGKVEIHEMSMDNGVMKMRPVNGLEIPAGKSVELKPGGYHIMFMQLKHPLKAGETVKGVLTFEKAGAVPVEYKVEAMGAGHAGGGHDMKGMGDHKQ